MYFCKYKAGKARRGRAGRYVDTSLHGPVVRARLRASYLPAAAGAVGGSAAAASAARGRLLRIERAKL